MCWLYFVVGFVISLILDIWYIKSEMKNSYWRYENHPKRCIDAKSFELVFLTFATIIAWPVMLVGIILIKTLKFFLNVILLKLATFKLSDLKSPKMPKFKVKKK